jgi:hypothetical protein
MSTSVRAHSPLSWFGISERAVSASLMLWYTSFYRSHLVSSSHPQPNLVPPITTTNQALEYKAELQAIDPNVEYLMTLYLSPDLTPEEIKKAKNAGIIGESDLIICVDNTVTCCPRSQVIS